MHTTDNSDIAIEKSTNHCSQSARALEKWEGLAYACEYAIPAEFYFKTVAVFSLPCWHLICFDILCRSRSVTNTKHYESMTQWVTTTLPRGAPCCQGSPLVVKVVGGEQASSLWWCCSARSPSTGENHLSRIFAAHHQPAPSPHNDLDWENVNLFWFLQMEKQTTLWKSCTFKHVSLDQMTIRWIEVKTSASEILTWKTNQFDKQWSRAERDKTQRQQKWFGLMWDQWKGRRLDLLKNDQFSFMP